MTTMIRRRRLLHAGALAATCAVAPLHAGAALPDRRARAAHLLGRLSFGPLPGELDRVATDPDAWLDAQLAPRAPAPALESAAQLAALDPAAAVHELQQRRLQRRQERRDAASAAEREDEDPVRAYVRPLQEAAVRARVVPALAASTGAALAPVEGSALEAAMVDFWFNHFNVDQGKNPLGVLTGAYEQQAIRPFALGRFRDLLGAATQHPAMLYYLDNWRSVGEGTARAAGDMPRGLNENHARELMELHTLGVDAGYAQRDVTELARMLTGWTVERGERSANARARRDGARMPGFLFEPRWHDMGEKTWLGERVRPAGVAEGDAALDRLARHPATAAHVAWKLARHFVADEPDAALVQAVAQAFRTHDGQLRPVLRVLFTHPAFMASAGAKFKTPYRYVLSVLRAAGTRWPAGGDGPGRSPEAALASVWQGMGMPLHGCPTPDGWAPVEAAWLTPDAMSRRVQFAMQVARGRLGNERLHDGLDADALADTLGPGCDAATRQEARAAARRGDPALAAALVLAGPAMMRH